MSSTPRPIASIVIPVFDEVFLTRVCLTSLQLADLGTAEIVVVDNGSTDSTPDLLRDWSQAGPRRRFVRSDENLGFARGCNLGAQESDGEFLVFLNNDTFVMPDWLPRLLEPFADPAIWVTGSRLLYPNGRIQHAGVVFVDDGPGHVFAGLPGDSPLVLEPREYQAVTAASLAIRRESFELVGGYDTRYRNSYEDSDLCLKVRAAGGRILYQPSSVAYHWESMSKGRLSENDFRNKELFLERWQGKFEPDYTRVMAEAEGAGFDLSDRLPSRREQHDRQLQLENSAAEIDKLEKRIRILTAERDLLRMTVDSRVIRGARWVARKGRGGLRRSRAVARRGRARGRALVDNQREQRRRRAEVRSQPPPPGPAPVRPPDAPLGPFRMYPPAADDAGVAALVAAGAWDSPQAAYAAAFLRGLRARNRGLFLDLGASEGFFSLLAASAAPHLSVRAFEARPEEFDELVRNLELNPVLSARVAVVGAAVSDLDQLLERAPAAPVSAIRVGPSQIGDDPLSGGTRTIERDRPLVFAGPDAIPDGFLARHDYAAIEPGWILVPREQLEEWVALLGPAAAAPDPAPTATG